MKHTVMDSAALTIEATLAIWEKARIPAQRKDNCMRKLRKLFEQYRSLKKRRLLRDDGRNCKITLFEGDQIAMRCIRCICIHFLEMICADIVF